jgi:hypothetical protein
VRYDGHVLEPDIPNDGCDGLRGVMRHHMSGQTVQPTAALTRGRHRRELHVIEIG